MALLPSVQLALDIDQIEDLAPLIEQANAAAARGEPGTIAAQVFGSGLRVFFLEQTKAHQFHQIEGIPPVHIV